MSILFEPINIGEKVVKNRIVRSATNDWLGEEDGKISNAELNIYKNLAINDVGLIVSAHAYVEHPIGKASIKQNAIYNNSFISGYQKVANTVHKYGSIFIVQISHAGRLISKEMDVDLVPIAPSPFTNKLTGKKARQINNNEINQLINDFISAALRVYKAGCDGVQLHAAHGYMLSQFLSPFYNQRTDKWGGSVKNRMRLLYEIISGIKSQTDKYFNVIVKLNTVDGYLTSNEVVEMAKMLESFGVSAIEVSGGINEVSHEMSKENITCQENEAYFAKISKYIKGTTNIPIILVGGLRSKVIMESVIRNKIADMVSMSRPFIRQPNLVKELKEGKQKALCISCNACFNPKGLKCMFENSC